jgi:hypothetical protein
MSIVNYNLLVKDAYTCIVFVILNIVFSAQLSSLSTHVGFCFYINMIAPCDEGQP